MNTAFTHEVESELAALENGGGSDTAKKELLIRLLAMIPHYDADYLLLVFGGELSWQKLETPGSKQVGALEHVVPIIKRHTTPTMAASFLDFLTK